MSDWDNIRKKAARQSSNVEVGSQLGSYEVVSFLGKGGMGRVYRVRHRNPKVAKQQGDRVIKLMNSEVRTNTLFKEKFTDEALHGLKLNHPQIVRTYDLLDDG